jgi:hypothetical protein
LRRFITRPGVLDEAEVLRHLVVQRAARRVGGMSQPVDALAALLLRQVVHGEDQRAADAVPAFVGIGEQVIQVAQRLDARVLRWKR